MVQYICSKTKTWNDPIYSTKIRFFCRALMWYLLCRDMKSSRRWRGRERWSMMLKRGPPGGYSLKLSWSNISRTDGSSWRGKESGDILKPVQVQIRFYSFILFYSWIQYVLLWMSQILYLFVFSLSLTIFTRVMHHRTDLVLSPPTHKLQQCSLSFSISLISNSFQE